MSDVEALKKRIKELADENAELRERFEIDEGLETAAERHRSYRARHVKVAKDLPPPVPMTAEDYARVDAEARATVREFERATRGMERVPLVTDRHGCVTCRKLRREVADAVRDRDRFARRMLELERRIRAAVGALEPGGHGGPGRPTREQ